MKLPTGQNRKGLIFLFFALILGFAAAGMVLAAGQKVTPNQPVMVAVQEILPGDPLTREMFREEKMAHAGLPEGTLRPGEIDWTRVIASHGIMPGDILRKSGIIQPDNFEPSLLSARLRVLDNPSLRGMEVPVEAAAGLLGGMKAGDHIDIISVFQDDGLDNTVQKLTVKTIIEAAPVIGVREQGEESGVLIVALTKKQAETLALARESGKVYASLRSLGITVNKTDGGGKKDGYQSGGFDDQLGGSGPR